MLYQFGSGNLYGLVGSVPVARKFGALQDVSVDVQFTSKSLYGQYQFPLVIARGQGKIQGKAKFASLNGPMLNDLFFSQSNAAGQTIPIYGEQLTVPGTPYQATVANGATFKEDLAVYYAATGVPLTRVASAPATGQYSVNNATGQYTFAAGDTGLVMLVDYSYTSASTGNLTTGTNSQAGTTPTFAIVFPMKYNAKQIYFRLNVCTSLKLTLASKIEDFVIPEFDFEAMADAAGNVFTFSAAE